MMSMHGLNDWKNYFNKLITIEIRIRYKLSFAIRIFNVYVAYGGGGISVVKLQTLPAVLPQSLTESIRQ